MTEESQDINAIADHLFRENSGKMVAALCRVFSLQQMDNVLDIVQDTFETALRKWKFSGIPENPSAWLMKVAKNKAINFFERYGKSSAIEPSAFIKNNGQNIEYQLDHYFMPHEIEDSQLRLLLTCCHPELSDKNQIILTLHILSGFGVEEIANGLLMHTEAVKKALLRSKAILKSKGRILLSPSLLLFEKRIEVVHTILYLMFNEGYKSTRSASIINNDLCFEAVRLAKLLLKKGVALKDETAALLALMFFNLSRFPARLTAEGEIITLADQDRSQWDQKFITEGFFYLSKATEGERLSQFHLEAIISSIHCSAKYIEETDWQKIVFLYEQMELVNKSPILKLNALVAKSYIYGPERGLKMLGELKGDRAFTETYLLLAVEGEFFERSGQEEIAKKCYEQAILLTRNQPDKQFLEKKISKLRAK